MADEDYAEERHRAFVALMDRVLKLERRFEDHQRATHTALAALLKLIKAHDDQTGDGGTPA